MIVACDVIAKNYFQYGNFLFLLFFSPLFISFELCVIFRKRNFDTLSLHVHEFIYEISLLRFMKSKTNTSKIIRFFLRRDPSAARIRQIRATRMAKDTQC